jgi:hypothetical protein
MWDCASALGLTPHEARIGEGFMRAEPQITGAIPRGTGLTRNSSNPLARAQAPHVMECLQSRCRMHPARRRPYGAALVTEPSSRYAVTFPSPFRSTTRSTKTNSGDARRIVDSAT